MSPADSDRESRSFPLSARQKALWLLDRMEPGNATYNLPFVLHLDADRVEGPPDGRTVERALLELVERHEALRLTFVETEEGVEGRLLAEARVDFRERDAEGLSESELRGAISEAALEPFDLDRGPLLRGVFLRREEGAILVFGCHHLVADFNSVRVLLEELGRSDLAPPALRLADLNRAEEERARGANGARLEEGWTELLANRPEALDLPTDRPRPQRQSLAGATIDVDFELALVEPLARLGGAKGTSVSAMLALYAAVLGRWSGAPDFLVGLLASLRSPDAQGVVGYFVNTLPARFDLKGAASFEEVLDRVRSGARRAFALRDLPFPYLVEKLGLVRDPSRPALIQVMFNWLMMPGRDAGELAACILGRKRPVRLGGFAARVETAIPENAQFELSLELAEVSEGVVGRLIYNRDLFDRTTIARFARYLKVFARAALERPDVPLSSLPMLAAAERAQLLAGFNDVPLAHAAEETLVSLCAQGGRPRLEAVAVVDGERRLTYAALDRDSTRLAHRLVHLGVGPEERVAVCLPRGLELVTALLGVLKAGGAYVPLDPAYPAARLEMMIRDSAARCAVHGPSTRGAIESAFEPERRVEVGAALAAAETERPLPVAQPENLAYLIYTSGSTGGPKGVAIRHAGAAALVEWSRGVFDESELDGVVAGTSVCFDLSVFEIFVPLARGGRVLMVRDALALADTPGRAEARLVNTVPSAMTELVDLEALPPSVVTVNLAGEALSRSLVEAIHRARPGARVLNLYGPSEDTTYSTWAEAHSGSESAPAIGRPVGGTGAFVVSGDGLPVPIGAPGELLLGGQGLARGYFGRPATTAAAFVPDSLSGRAGERLYRTGDLVRWRSDGDLEFLGRRDHQVKIRGFRIELGEIEDQLLAQPGVAETVVVARSGGLVAYVVPTEPSAVEENPAAILSEALGRQLPAHMVPGRWVVLDALPQTPNGKVDRRRLPEPGPEASPASRGRMPETASEALVAEIYGQVLELEEVAADASLFALGGHSLSAAKVVARLRRALGVELSVGAIFEARTPAAVARLLASADRSTAGEPIPTAEDQDDAPASFAQERMWLLDRLAPGLSLYNVPLAFSLNGPLEVGRLARAVSEVWARHPALRTVLPSVEGVPRQRISPQLPTRLPTVDLSGLGPGAGSLAATLLDRGARRAFDLEAGPLVRVALLRLAPGEHRLLVVAHHAVVDGGSLPILLETLGAAYAADSASGSTVPAPSYIDFTHWQRQRMTPERIAKEASWWRSTLLDAPTSLELPEDRPRPARPTFDGGLVEQAVPSRLGAALASFAQERGATLFMLLHAALGALLARLGAGSDLVIGTPVAGRDHPDLERVVGLFVNTVAVRLDLGGDPSLLELVARSRRSTLAALSHAELPFDLVVRELEGSSDGEGRQPFEVLLAVEREVAPPILQGTAVRPIPVTLGEAKFPLLLAARESRDGQLGLVWTFRSERFDRATVGRWSRQLLRLVEAGLGHPDRPLSALQLLSSTERHQLVREWNDEPWRTRSGLIHEVVAERARERPDAIAVAAPATLASYGHLRVTSGRLAARLRTEGVAPEARVGVCVGRSPALPAAVLGALEAGGAYVPLDPSDSSERRALIAEDAGLAALVADEGAELGLPGTIPVLAVEHAGTSSPPAVRVLPEHPAYLIYTSGSTGRPKGVVVTHGAAVNRLSFSVERDSGAVSMLAKATTTFDVSVLEILLPLLAGGRLVLAATGEERDVEAVARRLAEERVAQISLLPSQLALMVEQDLLADGALGTVITGSETVPVNLPGRFRERYPGVEIFNRYGPSETTISVLSWPCRLARRRPFLPIGRPIAAARVTVRDRRGDLVGTGVPGEIWISGPGLARGYLGRPARTAESFVPDPDGREPGERAYRSGDLGRVAPDGAIEFLGRVDQQVKVRGFRVELGEIEAALGRVSGVREAVVADFEDPTIGGRRLAAYVVAEDEAGAEARASALLERTEAELAAALPPHMVPAAFTRIDEIPVSGPGKVDRRRLPAPDWRGAEDTTAPRTGLEAELAAVFAEVLGVERVGAHASFFELGGHSLAAARVVARVRESLGRELALPLLFETPTVAGLAARLETAVGERLAIERQPREGVFPLSLQQEQLWFLDRLDPGRSTYNVASTLELGGPLNASALAEALDGVVARHEGLSWEIDPREPVQRWRGGTPAELPSVDLSGLSRGAAASEAARAAERFARRPFELHRPPLLAAALVRLATDRHHLLLSVHHIVADGWSMSILLGEIAQLYGTAARGAGSELPEPSIAPADHAVWQQEAGAPTLDAELEWWSEALRGAPETLALPLDRPRPARSAGRGGRVPIEVPSSTVEALDALARSQGVTLFMLVASTLAAALSRACGQPEVVFGTAVAGRGRPRLEPLVGHFVNLLPLRVDLADAPTGAALVAQVREVALAAFAHQELPHSKRVEHLRPEGGAQGERPFEVVLALQNAPRAALELPGLEADWRIHHTGDAKFDLTLDLARRGGGLRGSVEYDLELFDRTTATRWARSLERGLAAVATSFESPVSRWTEAPAWERQQVLVEWNDSGLEASSRPAPLQVADWAARRPDAIAVADEQSTLSYAGLARRATSLAGRLRGVGAGRGEIVAIELERSLALVETIVGVAWSGAAYLPIDPAYPADRRAFMLEDSGALARIAAGSDGDPSPTVEALRAAAPRPPREPMAGLLPEDLAYVIYTSGSTGRPKGTLLGHLGLSNLVAWQRSAHRVGPDDRSSMVAGVGFDASVWELWSYLTAGARLEVASAERVAEPARLACWIEQRAITLCFLPTPLAEAVLDVPGGLVAAPPRTLLTGGDRLSQRGDAASSFVLANHYGPTEATVVATWGVVDRAGNGPPPIGRPVSNLGALIVDRHLDPVPLGAAGELVLSGPGLAWGYLARPRRTASGFVPSPRSAHPGERLYRTGDLVRFRTSGEIEFLGRIDQQVKVRGFRIELGEIEAVALEDPAVAAAVIDAREGAAGRELAGWLVPAEGAEPAALAERVSQRLTDRLPDYMVPTAWALLPELPLTANGKVDRRALPEPRRSSEDTSVELPQGPLEELVAAAFGELLGVERVGRRADFFELGGHSLLAARLAGRIEEAIGTPVSVRDLFEGATVERVAAMLARARGDHEVAPAIVAGSAPSPAPASFAQERLWFLSKLDPDSPAYNLAAVLILEGELVAVALESALASVRSRHESLRTTFDSIDGKVVQRVAEPGGAFLPVVDLRALREADRGEVAPALARRRGQEPFDLARGPLFATVLFRLSAAEHRLLVVHHHIITDGWSITLLLRELSAAYAERLTGSVPVAEAPSVSYRDYAAWQRDWLDGDRLEELAQAASASLEGAPDSLDLPFDRPRPNRPTFAVASVPFRIDPGLSAAVKELGQRFGATPFMVLLSAFGLLLARLSGQTDVVVGSPVAGRLRRETEGLVGLFVNTVVPRLDLAGTPTFGELVERIREATLTAFAHQELPFEKLVEAMAAGRDFSSTPLFQVLFVLQNLPPAEIAMPGLEVTREPLAPEAAKFDLSLALTESEAGYAATFELARDVLDTTSVHRWAGHWLKLLRAATQAPEVPLHELDLLAPAERHAVLLEHNDAATRYADSGARLDELIFRRLAATPDATVLAFEQDRLTCAELARRASALAGWLQHQGVGPGASVGVAIERSLELVVALVAVLRSGGAYVPLDPSYPDDRLRFMIEDAALPLVLTQEHLADRLATLAPEGGCRQLAVDVAQEEIEDAPTPAENPARPEDLAYTIFTSGSTGRPKGAMNSHRAIVNRLLWMQSAYRLDDRDRILQKTPASFDVSVWEFFWPLMSGACLVVARPEGHKDASYLARLVAREAITILHFVPSMLRIFLEAPGLEDCRATRTVVASGEALTPDLVARIHDRFGGRAKLENLYGPTEAAVDVTVWPCPPGDDAVPIGRPVANTQIHVFDRHGRPQPLGVPGEVAIAGVQLARGYRRRPSLTASRFVPDPVSTEPGARAYRTGDLARRRPGGEVEYLGRLDFQVKVRGLRIELGEIEATLDRHPAVRQSVVVARTIEAGDAQLVAYVVASQDPEPEAADQLAAELKTFVGATLPEHMVPAVVISLDEMPLNPSGKVDRRALPEPTLAAAPEGAYRAPETEVEEVLCQLWQTLLDLERVGVDDDFFALGGHSLKATQLLLRVEAEFGVEVPVRRFLEEPTVAGLSLAVAEALLGDADDGMREALLAALGGGD